MIDASQAQKVTTIDGEPEVGEQHVKTSSQSTPPVVSTDEVSAVSQSAAGDRDRDDGAVRSDNLPAGALLEGSIDRLAELEESLNRLRQLATQLAHDAARVVLDASDGEGSFRGGDVKRGELLRLRSSVAEYLREHEGRTGKRIFEDSDDREVLGLN